MTDQRQTRWKRRAIVAVVIGCVLNIAVAWLLALATADLRQVLPDHRELHTGPTTWPYESPTGWPTGPVREDIGFLVYQQREYWARLPGEPRTLCVMSQSLWGLPMLSLQLGSRYLNANPGRIHRMPLIRRGIRLTNSVDRGLPLDPVWPGFLVNTAFYTALAYGVLHVRARRRERERLALGIAKEDRVV